MRLVGRMAVVQRHVPAMRRQFERDDHARVGVRRRSPGPRGGWLMLSTIVFMGDGQAASLSALLQQRLRAAIRHDGGWLPFDRFMSMALYEPGLGYYDNGSLKFGQMPCSGSDFVTAPELSPLFAPRAGRAGGAGADGLRLDARSGSSVPAPARWRRNCWPNWATACGSITSSSCRHSCVRDRRSIASLGGHGCIWHDHWPRATRWRRAGQRSARRHAGAAAALGRQALVRAWRGRGWRPICLARPADGAAPAGAGRLRARHRGRASCAGRGLRAQPGREHGHARWPSSSTMVFRKTSTTTRSAPGGTLMCHRAHRADGNPLVDVGLKDITRACRLHRHRAGRARGRPGGAGLHLAGALSHQLRSCPACWTGALRTRPLRRNA